MGLKSIYSLKSITTNESGITARMVFDPGHEVFKGHFPGNPIVPGVVQVQILKELLEKAFSEKIFLNYTRSIKFINVINPLEAGEILFEITYEHLANDNWPIRCTVSDEERVYMKYIGNAQVLKPASL